MKLHFIPEPGSVNINSGSFCLNRETRIVLDPDLSQGNLLPAQQLTDEIMNCRGYRPVLTKGIVEAGDILLRRQKMQGDEAYRLQVSETGIVLSAATDTGLYYAVQTLRQLLRQIPAAAPVPCLKINDAPEFKVRGFYHDCTRGKVPKLETLLGLIEKLAHYKINQLQLYIEHAFAWRNYPEVWEGADPLTPEDILRLDAHCKLHHIDFVPSLSTFGHFYTFLRSKRLEHLNELEVKGSELPFCWFDRMAHYTLDVSNPQSIKLVTELIDEFAPLFSSPNFNICCDETFDLGSGRNAAKAAKVGKGRLYVDFLKQIIKAVRRHNRRPMFWGDVILHHPELLAELSGDLIALNWDYSPDLQRNGTETFAKSGLEQYVCPSVIGYNYWVNRINTASANITAFAKVGKKHGATGILNTDWGDYGHINLLGNAFHGMLLGAAAGWNPEKTEDGDFDHAFSILEMGDSAGRIGGLLRATDPPQLCDWWQFVRWATPDPQTKWDGNTGITVEFNQMKPKQLLAGYRKLMGLRQKITAIAATAKPGDPVAYQEFACGCLGAALMAATPLVLQKSLNLKINNGGLTTAAVADGIRRFEQELSELWQVRNRPSEYWRIRQTLLAGAAKLDGFHVSRPVNPCNASVKGAGG